MEPLNLRASATGMSPGYQVFMLVLCIYSLGILAFQAGDPAPTTRTVLDYADFLVCLVFLGDVVDPGGGRGPLGPRGAHPARAARPAPPI